MSKATNPKPKPSRPPKKSSFSDREYVNQSPSKEDIATLKDQKGQEIARFLPIEVIERDLDRWAWSTEGFAYQLFKDRFGNPCIAASLELVIMWVDEDGSVIRRTLSGGCNFVIGSYAPNRHFVATAKSECVKNAASDLGKRFGRGLNEEVIADQIEPPAGEKPMGKMKPDSKILEQYKKAQELGDKTVLTVLSNVYEFKNEENEL